MFERLMKATPFLSALFLVFGVITAIAAVMNRNLLTLTVSLFLIAQSVFLMMYRKMFGKIWRKQPEKK